MRLITDDTDHASIAIYESGIGILDPLLIDIGLSIPEVLPPADVRKGLELQRLIVLETLDIENGAQLPALCLAVPFRVAPEEEVENVSSAIHTWMTKLKNISLSNPREGFDLETADTPLRTGVLDGIRKHPMAKGASLHWAVSTGVSSRAWFIAGTTFESVQRLSARLGSLVDTDSMITESASQGVVHADQLSEVIEAFADMRKDNADVYAQSDSRLLNVMVSIASRFKDVRWDFKLQGPQEISGRIELSIPDSISSSEEVVRP